MFNIQKKEEKGITLVALVVTIIALIILAGIAVSMTVGDNGIFIKAKEAKKLQITAEAKEKIGTELLDAQVEAIGRNAELEQTQVEDIISKYGTLQDDKDTIVLKDNGYEISLSDIYKGTTTSTGSYTELKAKVALLEQKLEDASKTQTESNKELSDLKALLIQTTATEDTVLKDYKVYSNGKLITGTMANYTGQTQEAVATSDDTYTYLSIPNDGYYTTDSKLKTLSNNLGKNIVSGSYKLSRKTASATFEKRPVLITISGWGLSNPVSGFCIIKDDNSVAVDYRVSGDVYTISAKCVKNSDNTFTINIINSGFNWNGLKYNAVI